MDDSNPPFVCFKSLKNCLMLSHCKSDIGDFDKLFHISQALPFKHYGTIKCQDSAMFLFTILHLVNSSFNLSSA